MINIVKYKPFIEVETFNDFKTLKLSVDNKDNIYITYENNVQTFGTPDIKWGQFVFIVDSGIIYLKGHYYKEKDESKIPKVSNPTVGNYVTLASDGTLVDSGHSHSDYITEETRADWNENDTSSYAYILNKPDLSIYLTQHQSIKTINNQTITGTGNLNIAELPTVTSADNGKILMVVNGEWTMVSPWNTTNS